MLRNIPRRRVGVDKLKARQRVQILNQEIKDHNLSRISSSEDEGKMIRLWIYIEGRAHRIA